MEPIPWGQVQPVDEHNRARKQHLHPESWTNPDPAGCYNLLVVGAGPAGLVAAAGAAGLGARVALVERHLMGGDCLNVGCVPSKSLIRSARAAAHVREADAYGVRTAGDPDADFPAVMERMRRVRASISSHDSVQRFTDLGVDVFLGTGRFESPDTFRIGDKVLRFRKAALSTGARARLPETEGFVKVHTQRSTDKIVGATVVARHAGEMIGELCFAMRAGLGLKTIASTIHPYPTQAEAIKQAGDAYNRTRLKPWIKTLMRKWLAWRR